MRPIYISRDHDRHLRAGLSRHIWRTVDESGEPYWHFSLLGIAILVFGTAAFALACVGALYALGAAGRWLSVASVA